MFFFFALFLSLAGAVATVVLTEISPWFAILLFLGYFAAMLLLLFLIAICGAPFLSKKKIPKKPNRFARFILVEVYAIALRVMRIHCRISGKEHLPPKGTRFLIVCNHLSNFDHMLMIVKLHRYPISFISKPENFSIPIVGRYLWNSGFLSIDRRSARNAVATINETARRIKENGMCYGVFPEGTRSRTGKLLAFHSGVFHSAARAGAPVLVAHIHGTDRVFRRYPWRATRVDMKILGLIDSDYVTHHTDSQVSELARGMMIACVKEYGGEYVDTHAETAPDKGK